MGVKAVLACLVDLPCQGVLTYSLSLAVLVQQACRQVLLVLKNLVALGFGEATME